MSGSALMSLAMKGMAASYAGLQTTGHNIANAGVEGYSRQRAELATAQGQFTGAGFFGKGVDVTTVKRDYNQFLAGEAASTAGQAAFDAARSGQLEAMQAVFQGGEDGLGAQMGGLLNAFVDVASRPQDLAARQVVLAQAQTVAARFDEASGQLDTLQLGVRAALTDSVSQVNELADQLASVNDRIAKFKGSEHEPNDLLDMRDRLVAELSSFLPITTLKNPNDGTLGVFVTGGQQLVLGSSAQHLGLEVDEYDSSRASLVIEMNGTDVAIDTAAVVAGSMGGLLRFQDDDLVRARGLLGQMAVSFAEAVNTTHQAGTSLQPDAANPGQYLGGGAVFGTGPSGQVLAARGNTGSANVTMTVRGDLVRAREYELVNDAGNWRVRERPGGTEPPQWTDASGRLVADGMTIDLGSPPPAAGNRFLLQPVTRAASGMSALLTDPREVAAADAGGENGNARALVALRDATDVGRVQAGAAGAITGGATFTDGWASAMSDVGVRAQGAKTAAEISGAMADSAKASLSAVSGVNLDEEAANLLQQQQAYQACAKVLQVAQQVFEELLSVAGR